MQVFKQLLKAHLVALQVRSDVTGVELKSAQGLEQLRQLYNFDRDTGTYYDIRVQVNSPVVLKDKGIGRFPVMEK